MALNYASWQPGTERSDHIKQQENIHTNWQYRQYLMSNSLNIMKTNSLKACEESISCPGTKKQNKLNNTPYLFKNCHDTTTPYGYETSDLKDIYLTRHQLNCRQVTPVFRK